MQQKAMHFQLNPNLCFKRLSDDCFLIRDQSAGKFWKVSEYVMLSLAQFDNRVLEEGQLTNKSVELDSKVPEKFILNEFVPRNWVLENPEGTEYSIGRKPPAYIILSFIILPASIVNHIGSYLKVLFKKMIFIPLFTCCICFLMYSAINQSEIVLQSEYLMVFVFLMFISVSFHELGHGSALIYSGEKAGPIGGGFYLFAPIMYADVTNAWALDPIDRQRVNIGGIYFELVFFAIFYIIFEVMGCADLQNILLLIGLKSFWNLNPLLRSDGYWLLSDALGVSNLYQKSFAAWKQLLSKKKTALSPILLVYGALSFFTIGLSVYYTFLKGQAQLFTLPRDLLQGILKVFKGQSINMEFLEILGTLPILILYYFLGRLIIIGCKKVLKWCF